MTISCLECEALRSALTALFNECVEKGRLIDERDALAAALRERDEALFHMTLCRDELGAQLQERDERIERLEHERQDHIQQVMLRSREAQILTARVEALEGVLRPFQSGGDWGRWKAYLVHGPETMKHGIRAATQITQWQIAVDTALAPPPSREPQV